MKKNYIALHVRFGKIEHAEMILAGSFAASGLEGMDDYKGDGKENEEID